MRRFRTQFWRSSALLLAALLLAGPAASEPTEHPEDELAPMGDEPLDLSTPLPEPGRVTLKKKAPATAETPPFSTKVGVDYRRSPIPNAEFQSAFGPQNPDQSTGVGWANVTAADLPLGWDKASVKTQLDPLDERSKVSTTLSRSVPFGGDFSLTLQNGVAVERTFANTALSTQAGTSSQGWSSSQALRFNLLPTDTTLSLGANLSSGSDRWLRTLSAEQKLFGGPFNLTGSVSETTSGEASKSLKAGFKQTW